MTDASLTARLDAAFAALPLVAILRGLTPAEAETTAQALYDKGFRLIEVPLNSPQPFDSIAAIRKLLPADALVGAGTVMTLEQVSQLAGLGAELVVMPHADTEIIRATKAQGRSRRAEALSGGTDQPQDREGDAGGSAARRKAAAGRRHLAEYHAGVP
jgi:2-dehydro-3-deoxyphosphogalactonate aldolase